MPILKTKLFLELSAGTPLSGLIVVALHPEVRTSLGADPWLM